MKINTDRKPAFFLFNPFVYIAGGKALVLGLAGIFLAGFFGAFTNTHFDGVLDTHTGAGAPLWLFLAEGVVDWLCLGLVLLIAGRIISRTSFRTIDLLGTQALARWPAILIALATLPKGFARFSNSILEQIRDGKTIAFNTVDAVTFLIAVGVMLVLVIWMVALMYRSFSVSCNVAGGRAIGVFIGGVIVAEILSKIAVYGLFLTMGAPHNSHTVAASAPSRSAAGDAAITEAQAWLEEIDAGRYPDSWREAAALFRGAVTEQAWTNSMDTYRKPLGGLVSRELNLTQHLTHLTGVPDGDYVVFQFKTSFTGQSSAIETVTFVLEDGKWKLAGYYIK